MKTTALIAFVLGVALLGTACRKSEPAATDATAPPTTASAPSQADDPYQGWVAWNHPDGLFTVKFPGQYQLQDIQAGDPAGGTIPQAIQVAMPNVFFAQGEAYRTADETAFDPAAAIAGGRDSMLASMEARLLSEHKIALAGIDGVEFDYQGVAEGQPIWGTARIYAGGSPAAVYLVNAMRVTEADSPQAQAFLASLQIPAAGAEAAGPESAKQAD